MAEESPNISLEDDLEVLSNAGNEQEEEDLEVLSNAGEETEEEQEQEEQEEEEEEEEEEEKPGVLEQAASALAAAVGIEEGVKKEKKSRKPREKGVKKGVRVAPRDSASFFKARRKDIKAFGYTEDGDLQVPEMKGEPAKVIKLPFYIPTTSQEYEELEKQKHIELTRLDEEFDKTFNRYREALEIWRITGKSSDVITIQNELRVLDRERSDARSPLRWIHTEKSLEIRKVLVNEFYRTKKIGYPVSRLVNNGFTFKQIVKETDKAPEKPKLIDEFELPELTEEINVIFFDANDVDNFGILSPDFMTDFVYNNTQYNSLAQAYIVERLAKLGREDMRKTLLKSRSPAQMRALSLMGARGKEIDNPLALWVNIMKAYVKGFPEIKDVIQDLRGANFIYANEKELSWGAGLGPTDPEILNRAAWKGQNLVGKAWEIITKDLSLFDDEEGLPEQSGGALDVEERGKTKKDAKEQRSNVLAGYYRRKNF